MPKGLLLNQTSALCGGERTPPHPSHPAAMLAAARFSRRPSQHKLVPLLKHLRQTAPLQALTSLPQPKQPPQSQPLCFKLSSRQYPVQPQAKAARLAGWGAYYGTAAESLLLERSVLAHVGVIPNVQLMVGAPMYGEQALPVMLFKQVHGHAVYVVPAHSALSFPCDHHAACFPTADGVIAALDTVAFVIRTADCIPLLFHDVQARVWGALHVSWRSLKAGILETALLSLLPLQRGLRPAALYFYLGPSIQQCCYPVKMDVVTAFAPVLKAYNIVPELIYKRVAAGSAAGRETLHLNLPALCVQVLQKMGAHRSRISMSQQCTACSGEFFSHRAHATRYRNWNIVYKLSSGRG